MFTNGAVFARSSRILLPATDSVTDGLDPEHPIMLAIRVRKEAIEIQEKRRKAVRRMRF